MSISRTCLIYVHGTEFRFLPGSRRRKSDFAESPLAQQMMNETLVTRDQVFEFVWSGSNNVKARSLASDQFEMFLKSDAVRDADSLIVIAHSHGGNVALQGIGAARKPVFLATFGTPFLWEFSTVHTLLRCFWVMLALAVAVAGLMFSTAALIRYGGFLAGVGVICSISFLAWLLEWTTREMRFPRGLSRLCEELIGEKAASSEELSRVMEFGERSSLRHLVVFSILDEVCVLFVLVVPHILYECLPVIHGSLWTLFRVNPASSRWVLDENLSAIALVWFLSVFLALPISILTWIALGSLVGFGAQPGSFRVPMLIPKNPLDRTDLLHLWPTFVTSGGYKLTHNRLLARDDAIGAVVREIRDWKAGLNEQ